MKNRLIPIVKTIIVAVGFLTFPTDHYSNSEPSMAIYDVSLVKNSISSSPIKYGVSVPFTMVITNDGDMPIQNIQVIDYIPSGFVYNNATTNVWTPSSSVPNAYEKTIAGPLAPGESETITIDLIVQSTNDPNGWTNSAEVFAFQDDGGNQVEDQDVDSTPDNNPNNDSANEDDFDTQTIRVYDLALTKALITNPPYQYFDTLTYEITVYNQGNEATGQVIVTDYITEGFEYSPTLNAPLGWVGTAPKPLYGFQNLAVGASTTFEIKLVLLPNMFDAGAWDNYAEIFQISDTNGDVVNNFEADSTPNSNTIEENDVKPGDPDDNNIDGNGPLVGEDEDDHDPAGVRVIDIALKKEKVTAVTSYSYTQQVTYDIITFNQGNTPLSSLTIVDTIPCGLAFDPSFNPGWVYDASINSVRYVDNTPPVPSGSDTTKLIFDVNPCYQKNPEESWDNYAEVESIVASDGLMNYDIDGTLDFNFSNDIGGNLLENDNEINGNGPLVNEDEDNHDRERVDVFDLAIVNTIATPAPYDYGQLIDFNIRLINQGNIISEDIDIRSHIPDGYIFSVGNNVGWYMVNDSTIQYQHQPRLHPADSVDINLTLEITESNARRDWITRSYVYIPRDTLGLNRGDDADSFPFGEQSGEIAIMPNELGDNDIFVLGPPGTNSDEDDHDPAGFLVTDLELEKELINTGTLAYNQIIQYNITITNNGGNAVNEFTIHDYLPCGLEFIANSNIGWSFDPNTSELYYSHNQTLAAGQSIIIPINLRLVECQTPTIYSWTNKAEISSIEDEDGEDEDFDSTPDDDPDNDVPDEDDIDDEPLSIVDLSLEKTGPTGPFEVGEEVQFTIMVTNEGNTPMSNVTISDQLPCGLEFIPGSNPQWQSVNSSTVNTVITDVIQPGATYNLTITLRILSCSGQSAFTNRAEISDHEDENGDSPDDIDSTPDDDPTNDTPDEDDFDEHLIDVLLNATIGDYVWMDADGDGHQDFSENGIHNIPVYLYSPTGVLIANTNTDINGFYLFEDIEPGNYYIKFNAQSELTATVFRTSTNNSDSDINGSNGVNTTPTFAVNAGDEVRDIDAGFFICSNICGSIWYDQNKNDICNVMENGINGLVVRLYRLVNGSYELWEETLTGHQPGTGSEDGYFEFCTNPGTYYIKVIMPPYGLVQVRPHVGHPDTDSDLTNSFGAGTTASFTLLNNDSKCDIKGGYYPMARIGNLVWYDQNQNGMQDIDEEPASNVAISIYDENHDHVQSTVTDENGNYEFDYLQKMEYYIMVTPPSGYTFTTPDRGPHDRDSDITHQNGPNTSNMFMMSPGTNTNHVDVGLSSSILPVDWEDVSAHALTDFNRIKWNVSQELNLSHYEVLRWSDAIEDFISIGDVLPNIEMSYFLNDYAITNASKYTYAIKQVDLDGRSTISKSVSVKRNSFINDVSIFPNPSSDNIRISIKSDNTSELTNHLKIVGTDGQIIKQLKTTDKDIYLDVNDWPLGTYIVSIQNQYYNINKTFIKVQ